MKTTISPLLISLLGACMLVLGACSGVTGPDQNHRTNVPLCPGPDSLPTVGPLTSCPR